MTQKEHDKYQSDYKECCMLLGNLNEKQMSVLLEILKTISVNIANHEQYPDSEADGIEFCGKCGKMK